MPRSGRIRNFLREYKESPKIEKLSFLAPFLILLIECILLAHAIDLKEVYVILLTAVLVIISVAEIILVTLEIHEEHQRRNFGKILAIKVDDFVIDSKVKNVKKIVEDFIKKYPEYRLKRNEVYHTACQVLETHKEEEIEKKLMEDLNKFIKKNKKMNVNEIVKTFIKKNQKYKNYRDKIYEKTCEIKRKNN
ncbi:MAG: hypothetical protein DRM99_00800 [Thermoplasmata archaeon]|nr:MAG: hypothetical protein DRM99_00800 [Thermoplasmata archaeon]